MERTDYDQIIHSQLEDIAVIDYGIVKGNETIVFIKAGQDGSMYGYQNKYLKIARGRKKKIRFFVKII